MQIQLFHFCIYILLSQYTGKEQCHTPDSPEGARSHPPVVAPRSPISPHHMHPITTMIPASTNRSSSVNRHNSLSPTNNGTPPPNTATPSVHDSQRLLKIRRFLGALVQFGQDTNPDVGDRLRSLVLSLAVSINRGDFIFSFTQSVLSRAERRTVNRGIPNSRTRSHKLSTATERPPIPPFTFATAAKGNQQHGPR